MKEHPISRIDARHPDAKFRPRVEDIVCRFCGDTIDRAEDAARNHLGYACRKAPIDVRQACRG